MKRFFAGLLMAMGALIGGLSGLCTGFVVIAGMADKGDMALIGMALAVGIVPIGVGVGLFFAGRVLWRS